MKDSYWFKHDSNASRDFKLIRIKAIYDFWGIGIYWTIIEILRESSNYRIPEKDLPIMQKIIGCNDDIKFNNFIKESISIGLFTVKNGIFFSESLVERMIKWESCKSNGKKQKSTPKKSETEAKPQANQKPNDKPNGSIIEDRIDIIRKELVFDILEFYGFTELSGYNHLSGLNHLISDLIKEERLELFKEQWKNFKFYHVGENKRFAPDINNFILGKWNSQVWSLKLSEINPETEMSLETIPQKYRFIKSEPIPNLEIKIKYKEYKDPELIKWTNWFIQYLKDNNITRLSK